MKWSIAAAFAAGLVAGCMAGAPRPEAQTPPPGDAGPLGSPFVERGGLARTLSTPLIVDRMDLRIGTTVQFDRIPTAGELNEIERYPGLAHVVLALPDWPADFEPLQPLAGLPEGCDLIVVLADYPPSRAAAEVWNYLRVPERIIVVVPGPPPAPVAANDLNMLRGLERVIAQMDEPSRVGFERIQRPLSFRKIVE